MLQKIHQYLDTVTPESPPVLREMEQYAKENKFPIVGPLVGRVLFQYARMIKAKKILELGSGYGYSAYWFSLAARGKGHITMTDNNRAHKKQAFAYFKRAGLESQFDFRVGDALNIAKRLPGPFDIVLNDIDKADYPRTIDLAAAKLKKGGLFITDNVIWSGKVAAKSRDATTEAIVEFTRELLQDSRFHTTVLPLRDGLAVALKL